MYVRNGNTLVAVILILLMMAGSVGVFVLYQSMSSMHPDPHEASHDYVFEGTVDDKNYKGTGRTTYAQETLSEHDYVLKYTIGPVSESFFLAFTLEDRMVPKLFDHAGTGTIGDVTVDIWTHDSGSKHYRLYTAGPCILYRIEITSDTMSIVGNVILDQ